MKFDYVDLFFSRLYCRIKRNTSIELEELGVFRVFYGFFFLAYFAPRWAWIGDIPSAFFAPKYFSLASLFNTFPESSVFQVSELLLLICFFAITIGFFSRIAFFSTFLITTFAYSFQYSFGKIDHGSTWFIFSSLDLGLYECRNRISCNRKRP